MAPLAGEWTVSDCISFLRNVWRTPPQRPVFPILLTEMATDRNPYIVNQRKREICLSTPQAVLQVFSASQQGQSGGVQLGAIFRRPIENAVRPQLMPTGRGEVRRMYAGESGQKIFNVPRLQEVWCPATLFPEYLQKRKKLLAVKVETVP